MNELMNPKRKVVPGVGLIVVRAVLDGRLREGWRFDFAAPFVWGYPPDFDFGLVVVRVRGVGLRGGEFKMKRNGAERVERRFLGGLEEELLKLVGVGLEA